MHCNFNEHQQSTDYSIQGFNWFNHIKRRITKDYFEEKRKEYRAKQKGLEEKMEKLWNADEQYYLSSEYLLNVASRASDLFKSSEPHEKRQLLKMTFQNLVLDDKTARFDWIKPFDKIAYYASRQAWLHAIDEVRSCFI